MPGDRSRADVAAPPVLAEVVRSGFVESVHRGSVVALAASGERVLALGAVDVPVFPRSCNKPLQAAGMLRLGVVEAHGLEPRHVAVMSASHSGEQVHIDTVRDLLARASVPESALGCPHGMPLDAAASRALLSRGLEPSRIQHNCSGKHAGMLATCAANGWPLATYLEPDHPLQVALLATIEELTGEPVTAVGVDGCGAPLFALTLAGLARGFVQLPTAADNSAERQVADAMRAHPDLVGGTDRDVTTLMSYVPGLVAKDGAEGCLAGATADGAGFALKVADGAGRAAGAIGVAALRTLGLPIADELAGVAEPVVLGGGEPVGIIRATVT